MKTKNNNKKELFKPSLTKEVLQIIGGAVGGLIDFREYIYRPNLFDLYKSRQVKNEEKREEIKEKRRISQMITKLKKSDLIIEDKKKRLMLTKKGWLKLISYPLEMKRSKKKKSNEIYIVIFDVPERLKRARNLFRKSLYGLGFDYLQNSVFQTNREQSFKLIRHLVHKCDLSQFVKFIIAKKVI